MRGFLVVSLLPLLLTGAYFGLDAFIRQKKYLADTATIRSIALQALAMPPAPGQDAPSLEAMFANITQAVSALLPPGTAYPHTESEPFIFMRAGGWMGAFKLLYASTTEYILLFGTAIDTSGHSGRYWADISDTLLSGTFRQWEENTLHPIVHKAGATVLHPAWSVTGVNWSSGTWMLEHATGVIPTTMGFAFSDGIFSANDFYTLGKSLVVYAKHVTHNMLHGRL